jgi:cell fate regulator YaaT (PSP1 superfamily)
MDIYVEHDLTTKIDTFKYNSSSVPRIGEYITYEDLQSEKVYAFKVVNVLYHVSGEEKDVQIMAEFEYEGHI